MRILFVTSEFYPLVKTGGLADVSAALPAALAELGIDVRVMVPGYSEALDGAEHLDGSVPLGEVPGAGTIRLLPARGPNSGLPLWLIDCPPLYQRAGGPYQDPDGRDWPDNDLRFAALSRAAARVSQGEHGLNWRPDVVHANDWHSGLVPLLLSHAATRRPATVLTIHNLAFQGLFDADRLPRLGLPADCFSPDGIEFYGRISFLKAGIRHADHLTTVSRTYAQEIQTPEFGCGLDGLLRQRAEHLVGIPNGADYRIWDPARDLALPRRYSLAEISGKRICKEVLQRELSLAVEPDTPVVTINGQTLERFPVRAGERIRLRLINAATARIFGLEFQGHRPQVIALDGQPVTPHEPQGGRIVLGPAMRADVLLDISGQPGDRFTVADTFYEGLEYRLVDLTYIDAPPLREHLLDAAIALPPNPLPEPDVSAAERHEVVFGGGMMGMMSSAMVGGERMDMRAMMRRGLAWTVNGVAATGHVHDPAVTLTRGRSYVFDLHNETAWWHPIHLHGHAFRVIARNGAPTRYREWQDTVLCAPRERVKIAFVADNPGDWMLHCHVLDHQAGGMMSMIRVA